jgi:hypothetical protein
MRWTLVNEGDRCFERIDVIPQIAAQPVVSRAAPAVAGAGR